ncbi:serine/threonine-protein kinase TBK1-like isoform X2 [Pomacea canaliculata]|nr:serine/threonine-protein kinase TBK1-like isoform X2 [Pomacea canaliculata]
MATLRGSKNYVWDTAKCLGQGATSLVYIGREKRTGEEVAVKVFTPQSYQRPRQVQMREFEVMKRLNHENVVRLLAIEQEQTTPNGTDVIVMELCPHGSLYNVLDSPENSSGLCEEEFLLVLKQITAGVKHLRDFDIIHRDIKPGNILRCVAEDGRSIYKLTDFGAARELQENEEFVSLYGTEEYLHPDMYERAVLRHSRGQQFGVHVDLWSLGVTFYHAATGNLPFRPYGGRRNKETMHLITAQKEPGVISGVQLTENGPIEWRRELPATCRLSVGLKRLITPFLAALLERDATRTWPFEQFFEQVAVITSKLVVDVFCPSLPCPLKIYTDKEDRYTRLQELIAEQTDIPPTEQLLLFEGQKLSDLVQVTQPVSTYHFDVTATNPIIVYSTTGAFPQKPYLPSIGQFPQMTQTMDTDYDYPQCKRCCGVLHTILEAVKSITNITFLINLSVHTYSAQLKRQMDRQQESLSRLTQQINVISQWQNTTLHHLVHHVHLLNLPVLLNSPIEPKVRSWLKVIQALHQTTKQECEEQMEKIQRGRNQALEQLQTVVTVLKTAGEWNSSLGCSPSDRCADKVKVMLERVKKIQLLFKENRSKRHLNYNDEQIHKFEKNKLGELCTRARSLLVDRCLSSRKQLYEGYKQWLETALNCQQRISQVAETVKQMNDLHSHLVNRLTSAEEKSSKLTDDCVEHLTKEMSAGVDGSMVVSRLTNGSNEFSIEFVNSPSSNSGSMTSRQERLDSLLDGICISRKTLEEVETLVSENMQLIRNFSLLTDESKAGDNGS